VARGCRVGVLDGGDTGVVGGRQRPEALVRPIPCPPVGGVPLVGVGCGGERADGAAGHRRIAPCWVLKEQPVGWDQLVGVFSEGPFPGVVSCGLPVRGGCQARPGLSYRLSSLVGWRCWWGVGVVGWLLVEKCIVDASIFVVKLSRADGGCLGTRSR
jgi:hypothetical protein